MKKMTFLTLTVVLLLILNAVTLFLLFQIRNGNRPGDPHGDRGKGPSDYITKELRLDDAQQKQFAALREQHQQIAKDSRREEERLHDIYFGLLKSDQPDRRKVDSVATLIADQRKKMANATFEHFSQLRTICHDDQKKLFDGTIDEIARMVAGHPPGGGPPPPGKQD